MSDSVILYSLTVPCAEESQVVLEGICETFLSSSQEVSDEAALIIRLSVAEACRNALMQRAPNGGLSLATLTFLTTGSTEKNDLSRIILEIQDPGRGLKIDGFYPPYQKSQVGKLYVLSKVLGQTIYARIDDPYNSSIMVIDQESEVELPRKQVVETLESAGFGLLALSKTWRKVKFSWDPKSGNMLRLSRPILEFSDHAFLDDEMTT